MSFFLASYIILKRFLIVKVFLVTFSFAFVPIMLCAVILGMKSTVLVELLGDILGWFILPRGGFFAGYTLSAVLIGCIHGLFLYQKNRIIADKKFMLKLVVSVVLVSVCISLGLNTLWSFCIMRKAAKVEFYKRVAKQLVLVPFKVITIYCTVNLLGERLNMIREC